MTPSAHPRPVALCLLALAFAASPAARAQTAAEITEAATAGEVPAEAPAADAPAADAPAADAPAADEAASDADAAEEPASEDTAAPETPTADGDAAEGDAPGEAAPRGDATEGDAPAGEATDESAAEAAPEAAPVAAPRPEGREPYQRVHVLPRSGGRAGGKHEISLIAPIQFGTKFVEHAGVGGEYAYHLRDSLALTGGFVWNWNAKWTPFSENDLNGNAGREPKAGGAVLAQWTGYAGVELTPIYGKFAVLDLGTAHFGFYVGTALGVSATKAQIAFGLDGVDGGRTFGSTGMRPTGQLNAGFRVFLGNLFALRLEVRDTVYSDQITKINGCNAGELAGTINPGTECRLDDFTDKSGDRGRAVSIIKEPSSGVTNNLAFNAALSVLF